MEELVFYIGLKGGNGFKKRAFEKALDALVAHSEVIVKGKDLKGIPNIGKSTIEHLTQFLDTGKIQYLEEMKADKVVNAYIIFNNVYGLGEASIKKLIEKGITDIVGLRAAFAKNPKLLNKKQAIGLKYYEDVMKRIPRPEIDALNSFIHSNSLIPDGMKYEITGSYRRGVASSGDIDIIVTGELNKFKEMLSRFQDTGIIVERLTDGPVKCLVIGKVPGFDTFRRIDFLYSPPKEFAFALLYFTGSKYFNTAMRGRALALGYSLNEHGLTMVKDGAHVDGNFHSEKDIFDFLGMKFKSPKERTSGMAVELINGSSGSKKPLEKPTAAPKPKKTKINNDNEPNVETLLNNFVQQGTVFLDTLSKEQIASMLLHAIDMYFNHEPVIDDDQYDVLNDYMAEKYPDYEMPIGADAGEGKVDLPYKMPSMNKLKTQKLIDNWFAKYPGIPGKLDNYIITSKMDGVSGMFYNENGERKLYTRGNGKMGQDISHIIPYLPQLQSVLDEKVTLRGELIMKKSVFQKKYAESFANARNLVSGIVNQSKNLDNPETIAKFKDLSFICYEVVFPHLDPERQSAMFTQVNGPDTPIMTRIVPSITMEELSGLLKQWRAEYQYEIDGVIVTANIANIEKTKAGKVGKDSKVKNPDHAFAFKMILDDQFVETFVTGVEWNPSKDGYLKPKIAINPVVIGGSTISFTTGFNAAYIRDNKIGVGSRVEIIKSGDVIPYIKSVLSAAKVTLMPPDKNSYVWNETGVDIVLVNPEENIEVVTQLLTKFIIDLKIDGVGKSTVGKIVDAGYNSIGKILAMSIDDLKQIDGIGAGNGAKIRDGLVNAIEKSALHEIMVASNMMGRGIGPAKIKTLMKEYPDVITSSESDEVKIANCIKLKGFAKTTCTAFVERIPKFINWMKKNGLEHKLHHGASATVGASDGAAVGAKGADAVVAHAISGITDKKNKAELVKLLKANGIAIDDSVKTTTAALHIPGLPYTSNKYKAAIKYGIPIYEFTNIEDIKKKLGLK
tara:strand:- start:9988 stop:13023 length:3036 start_codon:yes stop_codon:yes gene_type:complete